MAGIERELALAGEMQGMLLPSVLPNDVHRSFSARYRPHHHVGGDYYDAVPLAGGKVAVAMAEGVRNLTGANLAIASTGVAGPGADEDGNPVGRIYLAVAREASNPNCRRFEFGEIGADAILARTVDAALLMLAGVLGRDAA